MRCGEKGEVVMILESTYWVGKQARARIHYIFSLVASLLAASEQKNPYTSGRSVLRHIFFSLG